MVKSVLLGVDVLHYPLVKDLLAGNFSIRHLYAVAVLTVTVSFF
jgi:hypothetical protein